jgi:hypothetical protein
LADSRDDDDHHQNEEQHEQKAEHEREQEQDAVDDDDDDRRAAAPPPTSHRQYWGLDQRISVMKNHCRYLGILDVTFIILYIKLVNVHNHGRYK